MARHSHTRALVLPTRLSPRLPPRLIGCLASQGQVSSAPTATATAAAAPPSPLLECIGTGLDVQCFLEVGRWGGGGAHGTAGPAPTYPPLPPPQLAPCPLLLCLPLPPHSSPLTPYPSPLPAHPPPHTSYPYLPLKEETYVGPDSPRLPVEAAQAAAWYDAHSKEPRTALQSVLATLLLISPFFFWGTSMVAMKVQ